MKIPSTQWWMTDTFEDDEPLPQQLKDLAPYGAALVTVYMDGGSQPGWGLTDSGSGTFMENFLAKKFAARPKVFKQKKDGTPYAMVMRSFNAICIDIDGKNGGLENVGQLGLLAPTLAETSKSGNGYHLFYSLDQEWDEEFGFNSLSDVNGIVDGVDIRVTGCVYHHRQQRWNDRPIVPAPDHLLQRLVAKQQTRLAKADRLNKIISGGDDVDTLMLHEELKQDLAKPIAPGSRNNTLFAIGSKMYAAGYDDWQTDIENRAEELDMDSDEADKIVANITKYAP